MKWHYANYPLWACGRCHMIVWRPWMVKLPFTINDADESAYAFCEVCKVHTRWFTPRDLPHA